MSSTRGGLAETWAMARVKRARKAETLKQPSLSLMLRAPYFYPTPWSNSNSGSGWAIESSPGSCLSAVSSHAGGPRAGAMGGGLAGSPMCSRIARTEGASVMKAMRRISAPQRTNGVRLDRRRLVYQSSLTL